MLAVIIMDHRNYNKIKDYADQVDHSREVITAFEQEIVMPDNGPAIRTRGSLNFIGYSLFFNFGQFSSACFILSFFIFTP